jgi:hypothetical protein
MASIHQDAKSGAFRILFGFAALLTGKKGGLDVHREDAVEFLLGNVRQQLVEDQPGVIH